VKASLNGELSPEGTKEPAMQCRVAVSEGAEAAAQQPRSDRTLLIQRTASVAQVERRR
jgi:hypothetical protein